MRWLPSEARRLRLIADRIAHDLFHPQDVAIACSGRGELAFELARRLPHTRIVAFDLDEVALAEARARSAELGLERRLEFLEAEPACIPLPSGRFGGFVSDLVLYPTTEPTEFGQREIARILKPGGVVLIADLLVERPFERVLLGELEAIGLDHVCDARRGDFRTWLTDAGLTEVVVDDLTPLLRPVWEGRRAADADPDQLGYALLFDPVVGLGGAMFYVYVRARKPLVPVPRREQVAA